MPLKTLHALYGETYIRQQAALKGSIMLADGAEAKVGSKGAYVEKEGGFTKSSVNIKMSGATWHLVHYAKKGDTIKPPRPTSDPSFSSSIRTGLKFDYKRKKKCRREGVDEDEEEDEESGQSNEDGISGTSGSVMDVERSDDDGNNNLVNTVEKSDAEGCGDEATGAGGGVRRYPRMRNVPKALLSRLTSPSSSSTSPPTPPPLPRRSDRIREGKCKGSFWEGIRMVAPSPTPSVTSSRISFGESVDGDDEGEIGMRVQCRYDEMEGRNEDGLVGSLVRVGRWRDGIEEGEGSTDRAWFEGGRAGGEEVVEVFTSDDEPRGEGIEGHFNGMVDECEGLGEHGSGCEDVDERDGEGVDGVSCVPHCERALGDEIDDHPWRSITDTPSWEDDEKESVEMVCGVLSDEREEGEDIMPNTGGRVEMRYDGSEEEVEPHDDFNDNIPTNQPTTLLCQAPNPLPKTRISLPSYTPCTCCTGSCQGCYCDNPPPRHPPSRKLPQFPSYRFGPTMQYTTPSLKSHHHSHEWLEREMFR
ncbi:hypothetical protein HDV00_008604 [Rhizophlyctis rosea]|nr:hypothetical protein HDV00_008604 [Rhizophlyctis rosea]